MATAASSSRIPAGLTVIHPARVRQGSYRARTHYASPSRSPCASSSSSTDFSSSTSCIRDFILGYTTESERHIFLSDSAERKR